MRQIKRFPTNKSYKFGLGIGESFGGLKVKNGDFVTEEDIKKYEVGEQFLEPIGEERKDWEDEIPENTNIVMFSIEVEISGEDREEKQRMISQFKEEFKNHIRQKGTVILKVIGIKITKKKKRKSMR